MNSGRYMDDSSYAGVVDYERQDEHRYQIVEQAIAVQENSNTVSAIEYLKAHDVAAHVIARVLLEPHRRRAGRIG